MSFWSKLFGSTEVKPDGPSAAETERDRAVAFADNLEKECAGLRDERRKLKQEVEDLKLGRKIAEEDIKHLVRIKEESLKLEFERKQVADDRKRDQEIERVRNEYRDKIEKGLEGRVTEIKEMYGQILQRLPDVNVKLRGSLDGKA